MEKYLYIRKLISAAARIFAAVAVILCGAAVLGCSGETELRLTVTEITLFVGESRDLAPYAVFTPAVGDRAFSVRTEGDCLEVDGTVVRAVKAGSDRVIVSSNGKTAELDVSVEYAPLSYFEVSAENDVQTVRDSVKPVVLTAELFGAVTDKEVSWRVRGASSGTGESFTFSPSGYGEFTVTATAGDISSERVVKIYRPTAVTATYSGELNQSGAFTPVVFSAVEAIDLRNPRSVYEWRVNGETACSSAQFSFTPQSAGEYSVELIVNGESRLISGERSVTVSAVGGRAPTGKVVFDDEGGVFIKWTGGKLRYISIIAPNGKRTDIGGADAQYSYLFSGNSFRATEFIEVFSYSAGEYEIVLGGEAVGRFTFTQIPYEAKGYAETTVLYRNSLISSREDCMLWLWEMYARGDKGGAAYALSGVDCSGAASEFSALSGARVTLSGGDGVITATFVDCVSVPTRYEMISGATTYSVLPHIEYDENNRRPAGTAFEIDKLSHSVEVSESEELLYAALNGLKPLAASGSTADRALSSAKRILSYIIGEDYTAAQTVHAVYDWLQWQILKSSTGDMTVCSNYLEGVFGSSKVSRPESASRSAMTDLGTAKAFALMCAIEGIQCTIERSGDDYYNKTLIDGQWYNTDVWDGKEVLPNGAERTCHGKLLLDDAAFGAGSADRRASDPMLSPYLNKHEGDIYFDSHITADEGYGEVKAAVFCAFSETRLGTVSVRLVGRLDVINNGVYGAELAVEADDASRAEEIAEMAARAAGEYAEEILGKELSSGAVRTVVCGNVVHLTATAGAEV